MKTEYYTTHIAAMTAAAKHHQAGRGTTLHAPRSRAGVDLYRLDVFDTPDDVVQSEAFLNIMIGEV